MPFNEQFQVSIIIDKLLSLLKNFKNTLRHKTMEFCLKSLIIRLRIKEEACKHDQKEEVTTVPKKNSTLFWNQI